MTQTPLMSTLEEGAKRAVVLFIVAPAVSLIWLPYLGLPVDGYLHSLNISWPYVLCAFVSGWLIRRGFNAL